MGFVHLTASDDSEGVTTGRSLNLPHAGHDRACPRLYESGHDGASMVFGEFQVLGNFRQCYIRRYDLLHEYILLMCKKEQSATTIVVVYVIERLLKCYVCVLIILDELRKNVCGVGYFYCRL
jgi:hypothetical protein